MPTAISSLGAEATPMPTRAGGTAAAKNATAQIARLRIRWLVPNGGVRPGGAGSPGSQRWHVSP